MDEQWRLESVRVVDCFEWHAPTAFLANDVSPGYALIQDDKRLLHFAPRFLLTINHGAVAPPVATAADAIGIDVTGKWHGYRLHGSSSPAVLAAGVPSGTVLAGRNCAALPLFDCPVVLLRTPDISEVWVHASYAETLGSALNKTAQRAKPAGQ